MSKRSKRKKNRKNPSRKRSSARKRATVVLVNPSSPKKKRSRRRRSHANPKRRVSRRRRVVVIRSNPRRSRRRRRNPALGTMGQVGTALAGAAISTAISYGADQLNMSPGTQMAIAEGGIAAVAVASHLADLPSARDASIGVAVKDGFDRTRFLLMQKDAAAGTTSGKTSGTGAVRRRLSMGAVRMHGTESPVTASVGGGI